MPAFLLPRVTATTSARVVIDKEPRPIDQKQIEDLKDLASVVMDQIEMQLSAQRAVGQAQLMAKEIDHRVMNSLQFVSGLLPCKVGPGDGRG